MVIISDNKADIEIVRIISDLKSRRLISFGAIKTIITCRPRPMEDQIFGWRPPRVFFNREQRVYYRIAGPFPEGAIQHDRVCRRAGQLEFLVCFDVIGRLYVADHQGHGERDTKSGK